MTATHFSGPVIAGTKTTGETNGPNQGYVALEQFGNISYDATLVQSLHLYVPPGCRIDNIVIDVLTAYNSATSATLSVGITAGGTEYASGVNAKTAGRVTPTFTAAQLGKMSGQSILGVADPVVTDIYVTVTSVGQPTAGYLTARISYAQI